MLVLALHSSGYKTRIVKNRTEIARIKEKGQNYVSYNNRTSTADT